jgi:AraC-like DNA-binding protein
MAFHEIREYPLDIPITAVRFHNMNFLAHWHAEMELVLVLDGQITLGYNSGQSVLETGDMAMFSSDNIHFYDSKNDESTVLILVFRPDMIESVVDFAENASCSNIIVQKAAVENGGASDLTLIEMRSCFESIYDELNGRKPEYKLLIKARLIELIGLFRRFRRKDTETGANTALVDSNTKIIQKAIRYIGENYSHDISLEDISNYMNISTFYFSRIFSKSTGMTFKNYLNSYRIEKAQKMIVSTSQQIVDIAYECGFSSVRTFNRVFRTVRGITPSSLRDS